MICGGHTEPKPADDTCRQVLADVKSKVEGKMNATYTTFEVVNYTTQVVAGTNFVIKAHVGDNKHLAVKVFRPLPCNGTELEVTDVQVL